MKKSVLFVLIGLLFSISAVQAQKPGFGLRAGINTASVNNDIAISPHFGAYYSIVITENFGLQPELLYSIQPTHFNVNNVSATRRLSYFNLPIMAKIYVANGFNFQFGPYVGLLTSLRTDDDADVSIKADFRDMDYGVALGAAYEFPAGFNIGARYNLGLADVSGNSVSTTGAVVTVDTRHTNQYLQFFLGYTF